VVRDRLALLVDGGGALIVSESAMYDQDVFWVVWVRLKWRQ
jgi:hypothetical protein